MFIDTKQLIEITIHFKRKGYLFVALPNKPFKKLKPEEQEGYQSLTSQMKVLTWGMYNDLNEGAMVEDAEGNRRFNYKLFKEHKLQTTLSSWDAKDEQDKPVPINPKNLSSLAPSIAECILNEYDDYSGTSEDEEGN